MFESILSSETEVFLTFPAKTVLLTVMVSIILGIIVGVSYIVAARKKGVSHSLAMTLIIMPAIVAVMILLIGGNVARAFSLAGICTLVRFRSVPGDSKDISFIFLAVTSGLAVGMGYITYAVLFTVIILAVVLIYMFLVADNSEENEKLLRITIPENLNYHDAFDDIFDEYTVSVRLERTKTINLGTLFELTYSIKEKKNIDEKKFIDSLRERNGNLNIMVMRKVAEVERL